MASAPRDVCPSADGTVRQSAKRGNSLLATRSLCSAPMSALRSVRSIPANWFGRAEMRVLSGCAPRFRRENRAFLNPPAQFLQFGHLRIEVCRGVYEKCIEQGCQHDRTPLFDPARVAKQIFISGWLHQHRKMVSSDCADYHHPRPGWPPLRWPREGRGARNPHPHPHPHPRPSQTQEIGVNQFSTILG
jgi:hypothetical protein